MNLIDRKDVPITIGSSNLVNMHVINHGYLVRLPFKILTDKLSGDEFLLFRRALRILEICIELDFIVIEDVL